jgi:hypothetical protein
MPVTQDGAGRCIRTGLKGRVTNKDNEVPGDSCCWLLKGVLEMIILGNRYSQFHYQNNSVRLLSPQTGDRGGVIHT